MSWLHGIYHSMEPYISVDQHCTDESYRPSMLPAPYRISSIYAATLAHSFMMTIHTLIQKQCRLYYEVILSNMKI